MRAMEACPGHCSLSQQKKKDASIGECSPFGQTHKKTFPSDAQLHKLVFMRVFRSCLANQQRLTAPGKPAKRARMPPAPNLIYVLLLTHVFNNRTQPTHQRHNVLVGKVFAD